MARALLGAVRDSGARGQHLHAFFGCLYYAAMRSGEIIALKESNCIKSGVDPEEVAARAGHSIAVLYRFYAKILKGGQQQSDRLIARAGRGVTSPWRPDGVTTLSRSSSRPLLS
ncbi:hypothetical protein ABZT02_26145 [Streptomyces sp. NPDC005402]|uniref:hypothetical protein n=1 Tax=Streptomyces sp. NPDC005402 TaxID=3155338 RepID=UPI0033A2A6AF